MILLEKPFDSGYAIINIEIKKAVRQQKEELKFRVFNK